MSLALGRLPRRRGAAHGHPREDLELAADRPERDPARRQGDRRLPELDARRDRGEPRRLRRGDPAHAGRLRRRRLRREHLHRQERRHLHAGSLDLDPAGDHARHGDPDRAGSRPPRGREAVDPLRPLPRRRGLHERHRRRGDADPRGRRPRDRRPARSRSRSRRRTSTPCAAAASAGRSGSSTRPRRPRREHRTAGDPALVAVARRAGGGARARGAALGAAVARPDDRPLRGAVRRADRRAVRGRGLQRHGRAAPALPDRGSYGRATRRSRRRYSFASSANCFIYEGASRCSPTSTRGR